MNGSFWAKAATAASRPSIAALLLAAIVVAPQTTRAEEDEAPSYSGPLLERDALTGDWFGARAELYEKGVKFEATATGDFSTNLSGGLRRDEGFSGLLQLGLTLNLGKLVGWRGGEIYAGAYFIRGHGLTTFDVGNLLTISNIEFDRSNRLGEIYFKQTLFDDFLTVKIGQLAADSDFATSDAAGLFVNSTFGWPGLMGVNLPSGGPAYPVPTPGVHAALEFSEEWSFQAGLYNGDPAGENDVNFHNLGFPVDDGAFAIGELAYATMSGFGGLPGTYKVGAWYNSLQFEDLRTGVGRDGDYALYGVIDQTIWEGGPGGDLKDPSPSTTSLSAFARTVIAPQSNRNLIDYYFDAGFNLKGLVGSRPEDVFGVAVAYAHISKHAQGADRDDGTVPIRSSEMVIEANYKAQVAPWLHVQPFAQYVVRPGGGDPRPNNPGRRIKDASVIGFRTAVNF